MHLGGETVKNTENSPTRATYNFFTFFTFLHPSREAFCSEMISQLSVLQVKGLQDLPSQDSDITPGQYVIRSVGEQEVESDSDKVQAKVWFQSPVSDDSILYPGLVSSNMHMKHEAT